MKTIYSLCALVLCLCLLAPAAQTPSGPALRGTITDPSGALVPGALVQLRGPGGEQRQTTGVDGQYSFTNLRAGKYHRARDRQGLHGQPEAELRYQRSDGAGRAADDPGGYPGVERGRRSQRGIRRSRRPTAARSCSGEKELTTLSDDPDELQQQLQAMAGPGAGPNGGQIYIDGFTGGNLPNKSSIREVRINSNPFSPEYERPGFGRIEIFTRPGTDVVHGQFFGQYNKEALNSRNPLLTSAKRPQYRQDMFGVNLTGPIKKQKASFGLDAQRRSTQENAFILATTLDGEFRAAERESIDPHAADPTMGISPRLDYAINPQQHAGGALPVQPHELRQAGHRQFQPALEGLRSAQYGEHRAVDRDRRGERALHQRIALPVHALEFAKHRR